MKLFEYSISINKRFRCFPCQDANLGLLHLIVFSCFCQNSQHWGYKMMDEIPVKWSHHKQNLGFVPIMIRMETQKADVLRFCIDFVWAYTKGYFYSLKFMLKDYTRIYVQEVMFCSIVCVYITISTLPNYSSDNYHNITSTVCLSQVWWIQNIIIIKGILSLSRIRPAIVSNGKH